MGRPTSVETIAELRVRNRELEAEVKRLKFALSEHGCDWFGDRHASRFEAGGRESGEGLVPPSGSHPPAAANPAAHPDFVDCSCITAEEHAARKEAKT